ncbi:hypothetical protein ACLB2K_031658 [Fragaria x ananassa]
MRFLALNFVLRNGEFHRRGEDGRPKDALVNPSLMLLLAYNSQGLYYFRQGVSGLPSSGPMQHIPNIPLQPIIKPWPGRGWAIDFIGIIHPHSSEQHKFIIMATDFFTKSVEAESLKVAFATSVRNFIFCNIISCFVIPECIVTDRGAAFMTDSVVTFLTGYGIKLLHSTPYYAQTNSQAEASNKVILGILRKMLELNPRVWHLELYHTLWAYWSSKRGPIATTPYAIMFGHDAILPLEVHVTSLRVQEQHQLIGDDYVQAM